MKFKESIGFKVCTKILGGVLLLAWSLAANAQLSKWFANVADESGRALLFGQFICGVLGFFIFVFGIMEYKKQKAGQKDYGYAYGLFLVGVLLGIAAPAYIESIKSVTGEDVEIRSEFEGF